MDISHLRSEEIFLGLGFYKHLVPPGLKTPSGTEVWNHRQPFSFVPRPGSPARTKTEWTRPTSGCSVRRAISWSGATAWSGPPAPWSTDPGPSSKRSLRGRLLSWDEIFPSLKMSGLYHAGGTAARRLCPKSRRPEEQGIDRINRIHMIRKGRRQKARGRKQEAGSRSPGGSDLIRSTLGET